MKGTPRAESRGNGLKKSAPWRGEGRPAPTACARCEWQRFPRTAARTRRRRTPIAPAPAQAALPRGTLVCPATDSGMQRRLPSWRASRAKACTPTCTLDTPDANRPTGCWTLPEQRAVRLAEVADLERERNRIGIDAGIGYRRHRLGVQLAQLDLRVSREATLRDRKHCFADI